MVSEVVKPTSWVHICRFTCLIVQRLRDHRMYGPLNPAALLAKQLLYLGV